jgi:hypothetical protein
VLTHNGGIVDQKFPTSAPQRPRLVRRLVIGADAAHALDGLDAIVHALSTA